VSTKTFSFWLKMWQARFQSFSKIRIVWSILKEFKSGLLNSLLCRCIGLLFPISSSFNRFAPFKGGRRFKCSKRFALLKSFNRYA